MKQHRPEESFMKLGAAVFVFVMIYYLWQYIILFLAMIGAGWLYAEYQKNNR